MRLGLNLGYWGSGLGGASPGGGKQGPAQVLALVREAERLGYSSVWAAEAYGSDAATVLAWVAAQTTRIGIGSAVLQIPARTPAMTAMTAATLDTLSGGRFRLGLGVSGPQVSEGWHGVRFDQPLSRTREYVDVVRMALRRETVRYSGRHVQLPLPDGPGKALRLTARPPRPDLPIYLAAVGPGNLALAGEIAEGWLGVFFAPEHAEESLRHLRAGRLRRGDRADSGLPAGSTRADEPLAGFDLVPTVPVAVGDDPHACAAAVREHAALYLGGMGSRESNFYNALAVRMGYQEAAHEVQEHFLAGRHREAAAAVPFEFLDRTCLLGSPDRLAKRLGAYADAGVTTLSVTPYPPDPAPPDAALRTLRVVAEALDAAGLQQSGEESGEESGALEEEQR